MADNSTYEAIILFADLVGSARLSDVLRPKEYDEKVVKNFQKVACEVLRKLKMPDGIVHCDGGVRGDEVVLIMVFESGDEKSISKAAIEPLKLAVNLNIHWFLSKVNTPRIKEYTAPFRIAVGIHYGLVALNTHPRGKWKENNSLWTWEYESIMSPEGVAINFAKRVESASRASKTTGIMVSQSFVSVCRKAGLPVVIGEPLSVETKGFEEREPIYEIIAQDLVVEQVEQNDLLLDRNCELVRKAFRRDPTRNLWLMEFAIDILFLRGEVTDYTKAIELAEDATEITLNRRSLIYRAARCYHRRRQDEYDIDMAISYYKWASNSPNLIWASADLAAAYWKLGITSESSEERTKMLENAISSCDEVINTEPQHFYTYNLRALVIADYVIEQSIKIADYQKRKGKQLLENARNDLKRAKRLNKLPTYLYFGTELSIEFASKNYLGALKKWNKAEQELKRVEEDNANQIPPEDFFQPGFAVIGFLPPRPEQLRKRWKEIENICKERVNSVK